ncbi:hypothetical protein CDD81_5706 [Ophiocordyceps australis]|uniref:DUF4045 domain-containing protein n=1 Tax=Ophiocordyceps australis TaxID=1399860 RepID=A0A2C5Y9H2_9HYPO|nr:hypothetical protein CDD81_5706 [Ophiocordyceps australis]
MSDEVSKFLEQVERLRDQQIEDDEVRAREHQEFLAAKRERQARRDERARSISPQKSSPANTPPPASHRRSVQLSDSPRLHSPCPRLDSPRLDSPRGFPADASLPEPTPMALSSSPTKENEAPADAPQAGKRASVTTPPARSSTLSWQRRPNSRPGSRPLSMVAAENATHRSLDRASESEANTEPSPTKQQTAQALGSKDPAGVRGTEHQDGADMVSSMPQGLGSPARIHAAQFDGAGDEKPEPTASQPPSPTKGMGGFVQSAMMKRSDSVKRWSVTSPPPLNRADSVAGSRTPVSATRPRSTTRGAPTTPISSQPQVDRQSKHDATAKSDSRRDDDASLPTSPTKTMDPKRWSPTKSSWLESALNKPESPKSATKPSPSQPAWMVELNKAKAERAGNAAHKHQVSIGGLMRQSPVGEVVRPNTTGLGGIYSPPPNVTRPVKPSSMAADKAKDAAMGDDEQGGAAGKTVTSPSSLKLKSATDSPPKKDFRANLKPRSATQDSGKTNEPEFKNVFGNLRRTKTQNYVAPDELKENITRGKAALNATDGPRKSERKDEFKDAILKKRQDFERKQAQGKGVATKPSSSAAAADKALPEGLAKRTELGKAASGASTAASSRPASESGEADSKSGPVSTEAEPRDSGVPAAEASAPSAKVAAGRVGVGGGGGGGGGGGVANKLADRFNPALAGMLARGPPLAAAAGNDEARTQPGMGAGPSAEPGVAGPQLTHMTKGRARGPRRKAPSGSGAPAAASSKPTTGQRVSAETVEAKGVEERPAEAPKAKAVEERPAEVPKAKTGQKTPTETPKAKAMEEAAAEATKAKAVEEAAAEATKPTAGEQRPVEVPKPLSTPRQAPVDASPAPLSIQKKTALGNKPAFDRRDEDLAAQEPKQSGSPGKKSRPQSPEKATAEQTREQGSRPGKLNVKRMSLFLDDAKPGSQSPTKGGDDLVPSPTRSDRDGLPSMQGASPTRSPTRSPAKSPTKSWAAPINTDNAVTAKSRPASIITTGRTATEALTSPSKSASDVSSLLMQFFGPPQPRKEAHVDAADIVMTRPRSGERINTMSVQIVRMLGDGKKLPVSAQNERVLFEQEMYVCAHHYSSQTGAKAFEVYFWVGDEVGEAAASDALVFVQREARALGGRLVRLEQGKETAEFVQALGGVVIVRRGSSNKYDSLAPNMLCGRRFLGQVAFDQVDFASASLCSGFVYLITQAGTCFLWKGKGSHVDEVSCARLVGIDMALTGALLEYDEGSEPQSFWRLFGDAAAPRPHSADHWRLKPSYDRYSSRLFVSDAHARQQIVEIAPFCQSDLAPDAIYILDAFFEVYIIVGERANSQYASFRNALDFAQEYAILAAGMEDRPFVPVSTVVLEGIPRDMKPVFRKWDDARSPTLTRASPHYEPQQGLRRGRSLRVLTLTQALQAVSD